MVRIASAFRHGRLLYQEPGFRYHCRLLILMDIPPSPVVDVFAGPGGLGEGFPAAFGSDDSLSPPPIFLAASIEKDFWAHQTLRLRHFSRSFPPGKAPDAYYRYLGGAIDKEALYAAFPDAAHHADQPALRITLGPESRNEVRRIIANRLAKAPYWALIGGPPCQAYSTAGRSRMKGMSSFAHDKRHVLYQEYLKIIADHSPPVFVMENVKGLLSSKHQGRPMIGKILSDLTSPCHALGNPSERA